MTAMTSAFTYTVGGENVFLSLRFYSILNTLKTGILNCLNARSRDLIFRHRAFCI